MLAGGDARQRSDTVDIYDTATAMAEPRFQPNVEALQLVFPADIPPEQIEVRLGTHWIPPPDVNQFLAEVLDAEEPRWSRSGKQFLNFTSPYLERRPRAPLTYAASMFTT